MAGFIFLRSARVPLGQRQLWYSQSFAAPIKLQAGAIAMRFHAEILASVSTLFRKELAKDPRPETLVLPEKFAAVLENFRDAVYLGQTALDGDQIDLFSELLHHVGFVANSHLPFP